MSAIISTDLPCIGCGYNVRMQPETAVCPECGLAVRESLAHTLLRWGSSRLRRMSAMVRVQAACIILMPVVLITGVLLDELVLRRFIGSYYRYSRYVGVATFALATLVGVGYATAAWLAAGAPRGETQAVSRWVCRLTGLAVPLFLAIFMMIVGLEAFGVNLNYRVMDNVIYVFPVLLLGWGMHAERGAALWGALYQRGGIGNRAGFGKWSLRMLAAALLVLAAVFGAVLVLDALSRADVLPRRGLAPVEVIVSSVLLGDLGLGGIALLCVIIALFKCGNRLAELAVLARQARDSSFTGAAVPLTGTVSASPNTTDSL